MRFVVAALSSCLRAATVTTDLTARLTAGLVVVAGASAAHADIAPSPFAGGTGPQPRDEMARAVAMQSERVVITLYPGYAVVDADFVLVSQGKLARPIAIGFPGRGVMLGGFRAHPELVGFSASVNGKAAPCKTEEQSFTSKGGPPDRPYTKTRRETWHTLPATLSPGNNAVHVRYAVLASPIWLEGAPTATWAEVGYIMHTGALWNGSIDKAVVEVRRGDGGDLLHTSLRTAAMPEVSFVSLQGDGPPPPVQPSTTTRTKDALIDTRTALEPDDKDDLQVVWPVDFASLDNEAAVRASALRAAKASAPPVDSGGTCLQ